MLTTPPSLLERIRHSPERAAWERFVDLYTPLLYSWAKRLGLGEHDAADLVQDIFTVLVEKLPHFRYNADKSFRAWLKTLLMNRWRNWLRRKAAARQAGSARLPDLAREDAAPEFEEEEYRQHMVARALTLMRTEFPEITWKACWEYVVCDRPPAEVAKELGVSLNTVYLAKSRVLRKLREELQGLL